MSGVELSIGSVKGIANTSVCVPVSGGTSMHEDVVEVQMVSVITACMKCTELLWTCISWVLILTCLLTSRMELK